MILPYWSKYNLLFSLYGSGSEFICRDKLIYEFITEFEKSVSNSGSHSFASQVRCFITTANKFRDKTDIFGRDILITFASQSDLLPVLLIVTYCKYDLNKKDTDGFTFKDWYHQTTDGSRLFFFDDVRIYFDKQTNKFTITIDKKESTLADLIAKYGTHTSEKHY